MPNILIWNGYRFYFFSHEGKEPPHVHIDMAGCTAKFWFTPVRLASSRGFRDNQLREIEKKVREKQQEFLEAWHEHFKDHR
ncbi:MAG: DUF4160 domain-containing protein [Pseudomonadota bacterium]|nr:DUF4160 domain-containing protein [Pseudomonadota bacterium]